MASASQPTARHSSLRTTAEPGEARVRRASGKKSRLGSWWSGRRPCQGGPGLPVEGAAPQGPGGGLGGKEAAWSRWGGHLHREGLRPSLGTPGEGCGMPSRQRDPRGRKKIASGTHRARGTCGIRGAEGLQGEAWTSRARGLLQRPLWGAWPGGGRREAWTIPQVRLGSLAGARAGQEITWELTRGSPVTVGVRERLLGWEMLWGEGMGGGLGAPRRWGDCVPGAAPPGAPRTGSELGARMGRTPPLPGAPAPAAPALPVGRVCTAPSRPVWETPLQVGLPDTQGARPCPWHPRSAAVAPGRGVDVAAGGSRPYLERGSCSLYLIPPPSLLWLVGDAVTLAY